MKSQCCAPVGHFSDSLNLSDCLNDPLGSEENLALHIERTIQSQAEKAAVAWTDTLENAAKVLGIETSTLWRERQRLAL